MMHTTTFKPPLFEVIPNITLVAVEKIKIKHNENRNYLEVMTKLYVWSLIEYDQVMFYDLDFVFQHNPEVAYDRCGESTYLCAVEDRNFMQRFNYNTSYLNSGFMILRPNIFTYFSLSSMRDRAEKFLFPDQDVVNAEFKNKWIKIDPRYNFFETKFDKSKFFNIREDIIAIHERVFSLQLYSPDRGGRSYVWNSKELIETDLRANHRKRGKIGQNL